MSHTFKTNLGFLLACCLVGFFIPRSVSAYILSADRGTARAEAILNMALSRFNLQMVQGYNGKSFPDVTSALNIIHFQQYVQTQYPDYDWGSSFDVSRLADIGLYTVYCCIWPRSGVSGEFDVQIATCYRFQYRTVNSLEPSKAQVLVPFFFYGVYRTSNNITSTQFNSVSWEYVSDDVKFPFFGREHIFYAYKDYKVRQYPIAYNGTAQVTANQEITSLMYGTIAELVSVFNIARSTVSWGSSEQIPIVSLTTASQAADFNWINQSQNGVDFPPIFNWTTYDFDEGTEPDAHEFYVKHNREDPDDDWGDVSDDPSGDYGTVEVGPDTRESYSEKLDEYFGYDESDPEIPDAPNFESALSNLDGPADPKLLTDNQWNATDSGLSSAIQNTPIGAVLNNFSSGLGSSGGSSTLPSLQLKNLYT